MGRTPESPQLRGPTSHTPPTAVRVAAVVGEVCFEVGQGTRKAVNSMQADDWMMCRHTGVSAWGLVWVGGRGTEWPSRGGLKWAQNAENVTKNGKKAQLESQYRVFTRGRAVGA